MTTCGACTWTYSRDFSMQIHTCLNIVQCCSSSSQEEEGNEENIVQEEVQALAMLVNPAARGMLCQALLSPMSVLHL